MSKPVKKMIMRTYQSRFGELDSAVVVDVRGIEANDNNELRLSLLEDNIRVMVVKNTLARHAFEGTNLEPLGNSLEGPSALAYGGESVVDVARALVAWAKKIDQLELKAAILDGQVFEGKAGVEQLSKFPTREEAQAKVVQLVLAPAGNAIGAATGPGGQVLGIIKEIQTRLEEGKSIEKVA